MLNFKNYNKSLLVGLMVMFLIFTAEGRNLSTTNAFSHGSEQGLQYGVHEITLKGNPAKRPDDVNITFTFTDPDGITTTVYGFYDGNNSWKGRMYVTKTGSWKWRSSSSDGELNDQAGSFSVIASALPGKLRKHRRNIKMLMTDNGRTFNNLNDTQYMLFDEKSTQWQAYIAQLAEHGITSVRAMLIGRLTGYPYGFDEKPRPTGFAWQRYFLDKAQSKLNYANFKRADARLQWMLTNYPAMQVQLIMFPKCTTGGWPGDEAYWQTFTQTQKNRLMQAVVARYAAYPNIFWLIENDASYTAQRVNNRNFANEVGKYVKANDKFNTLLSTGGIRNETFKFLDAPWVSYIHIEIKDTTPETEINRYRDYPLHVFAGEDRYETHYQPKYPALFFRRHFWAWLLAGGSASYGGIWNRTRPYNSAKYKYGKGGADAFAFPIRAVLDKNKTYTVSGLDDIIFLKKFVDRVDLALYRPNNAAVTGDFSSPGNCSVMVKNDAGKKSYIIYHPNAPKCTKSSYYITGLSPAAATFTVNNLPTGNYNYRWLHCDDGTVNAGSFSHSGGNKSFVAPWSGIDVMLHITPQTPASPKEK